MTSSKTKPELSAADEASIYAATIVDRQLDAWQDSKLFMVPEAVIHDTKRLIIALADPFCGWARPRWKLLHAACEVVSDCERERTGKEWNPPRIDGAPLSRLRKLCSLVRELPIPQEAPKPRKVALEPIQTLIAQKVSMRQICVIYNWINADGTPDAEKYKAAEAGEIEPPRYRELPPEPDGTPARRPHPGKLESLADDFQFELETTHEAVVAELLDERDAERRRPAPGSRGRCPHACGEIDGTDNAAPEAARHAENASDAENESEAVAPKRPRGRPRKHVHLETTRTG